ncbi:DUF2478 domain-containing protein [Undibacter mobilis]|nr:DUF2478 domain-containing protein [Undibacter mobilis]
MSSNILAVLYSDGLAADRLLADIAYRLRDDGLSVAGLVQLNTFVRDRTKCDMAVEELYSRTVFQLSEDRGPAAKGCRLDHTRLIEAAGLFDEALKEEIDLVVLNKFGKIEAEGGGLRDALARAVALEVPLIVGVPYRNLDQWRHFAGGLADECDVSAPNILRWLAARGFATDLRNNEHAASDNLRP